ncbi:MAG: hypothetical protein HZY79_14240 [Rhodoblastus sp.]|nr:MAG: hypothetical protein HZY79_14240 [Rhodoblastus sp.]
MSLSADHEIVPGRKWTRKTKIVALALSLPLIAYAPGFVMALPQGVATSLPFWAEAPDYTCSSTPARSLMVRVAPYTNAARSARPKPSPTGWNCARITSFSESDLAGADAIASDGNQRYVRIYTPSHAERARLSALATPDDMSSRVVSLRPARPDSGAVAAGAPAR